MLVHTHHLNTGLQGNLSGIARRKGRPAARVRIGDRSGRSVGRVGPWREELHGCRPCAAAAEGHLQRGVIKTGFSDVDGIFEPFAFTDPDHVTKGGDLDIGSELLGQAIGNYGAIISGVRQNAGHLACDPHDEVGQGGFVADLVCGQQ